MRSEVFVEGGAKESAIDEEVKRDRGAGVQHRLRVENLREAISSDVYQLSDAYKCESLAVFLTGWNK